MILAKTQYQTHNGKLLTIVKTFKIWRHYLKDFKHKIFVLINYNNLQRFIDTKSFSFRQVRWTQELFKYHFWIDYHQSKANGAADALSCFLQRNKDKEKKFWAKNIQIFYCLQFSLTNATLSGPSFLDNSLPSHQVFICKSHDLS